MRDVINYTFTEGYFDTGNYVEIPEGSFINPSLNIVFDLNGRPVSYGGFSAASTIAKGGTRAFVLDKNLVGLLGSIDTSTNPDTVLTGIGNILQGVEKSLWFVGNTLTDGVKVLDITNPASIVEKQIGGTARSEKITVATGGSISHGGLTVGTTNAFDAINHTGHSFVVGQKVVFPTVGSPNTNVLPAPLVNNAIYYVRTSGTNSYQISTTPTGSVIDITGTDASVTINSPQIAVKVTHSSIGGGSKTILVDIASSGETTTTVATKIREALRSSADIAQHFYITSSGADVTLTDKQIRAVNFNVEILPNNNGVNTVTTSSVVAAEVVDTAANLSSIPQLAKWNGTYWDNAVQVGLPELDEADKPSLELTTSSTRSSGFDGLVKGSRSVRVARKRYDTVSIATPSSEVITASETGDSLTVSIPALPSDGTPKDQNNWILYFTYRGQGSTATHKQFPLEIPEAQLDGSETPTLQQQGNAKYKVISQGTLQANRVVEVEFNDNELFPIEPNDDTFSLEACKFLAKLGNVMCGIGVGEDSTGFDVSYPNEYESYPPDWRDWFAEVPVGVAPQEDMGFFWVTSANNTYMAKWTGVTEGSAPVIIEKVTNLYGSIGESAQCSVNGTLYMMSSAKVPIAISPDGQVNGNFGSRVLAAFSSYNENTIVSYDTSTGTVIFACGTTAIGYQVGTDKWTSPINLGVTALSMFTVQGTLWVCSFNSTTQVYNSDKWDSGTTPSGGWAIVSTFQGGSSGRALKDIIETEAVVSSELASGTITFSAYKNYAISITPPTLASETITSAGSFITIRKFAEDLDYDVIAARISGTVGGQSVHTAVYTVDVHRLERLTV